MSESVATGAKAGTAMPSSAISCFSARRSCETARLRAPGSTAVRAARKRDGGGRDVLEFVGDDVDGGGEVGERRLVVIGRDGAAAATAKAGLGGIGAVDVAVEAELGGGHGQHAAELAAAENADDHARAARAVHSSSGRSATAAVCSARQRSSRSATAASAVARMAAASSAALMAPARPMARVPTGTPAGIWTME